MEIYIFHPFLHIITPHILYDKKAKKSIKNTCKIKKCVIDHAACYNEK
jgi:hypothetical protein